jgi:hypothetical protein
MDYLFYIFMIPALVWELVVLKETEKVKIFMAKYKASEYKDKTSTDAAWGGLMLGYLAFTALGLFSSQWLLFLLLITISFIPFKNLYLMKLDALISIMLLLSIILNKFHFHVDIVNLILNF